MALKKHRDGHLHAQRGRRKSKRDYTSKEKADMLAPPEEKAGGVAQPPPQGARNGGAIVVGTGELKLPKGFGRETEESVSLFQLPPVVVILLIAFIAFVAFIAYLISIEPPK